MTSLHIAGTLTLDVISTGGAPPCLGGRVRQA
jgi:hypothetical protein